MLGRTSFDTLPEAVWIGASSLNTYGTNAIEGNTLTQAEVEAVLLSSKGVKRSMSDILETVQHERAFRNLVARRGRAIDLVTIQELHEDVFKGVMVDAGQWRRTSVTIQGAGFTPPRPEKIVPRLEELLAEYNRRDLEGEDPFTLGSWMHLEFEMIHPFSNGNGRVGRLLLNLHFLRHNWPPINVLPIDRDRYLSALQEGNRDGLDSMTALVEILMAGSLLTFLSQVGTSEDELRSLAELERGGAYSAKYLALRAKQGELPAVRIKHEWRSSNRALRLYIREVGRAGAS
ncbi:MAG: Fic family protein [Methanomassiliicoccales archaeon]|nr:Fic family protein [Methanomassiliicoccales archaeon]